MVRKSVQVLFVFALSSCHTAQAQNASTLKCDELLPASHVGPPYIVDDPTVPVLDVDDPTPSSRQYLFNVGAQDTHGVRRLRLLHNVYGEGSVVGVFDQAAVYDDHYQFLDANKRSSRVRPLWSRGQQGFFGDKPTCEGDNALPLPNCYSQHATHVAGTIASGGIDDPDAQPSPGANPKETQGMAPRIGLYSFTSDQDAFKLCHAATGDGGIVPIHVSNHSYGPILGWRLKCTKTDPEGKCSQATWRWYGKDSFGSYTYGPWADAFDRLVHSRKNLSVFWSAGNDRGRPNPTKEGWWSNPSVKNIYLRWKSPNWEEFTFEKNAVFEIGEDKLVSGGALAKNVITIGAIKKIPESQPDPEKTDPNTITSDQLNVTNFSSFGPRADGAIKPDLVAAGLSLHSPTISQKLIRFNDIKPETDRHWYEDMDGTSVATPVAAGIGALLNEVAFHRTRRVLRADEMKAILIHTALNHGVKNTTDIDAPNYQTGWGSIRADYAGWILDPATASRNANTVYRKHWIDVYEHAFPGGFLGEQSEARTDAQKPFTMSLEHISGADVRVTLVWLDRPGPELFDDLDLVVRGPTNTPHKVWCLYKESPANPAYKCDRNDIDNVERVDVRAGVEPTEGTWTIEVKRFKGDEAVPFALVVSGFKRNGQPPPPEQVPIPEPGTPPPSQACHACYDFPLRNAPYAGSPPQITVFQCDPVRIVRYDPNRPSWAYVTFEFPPFKGIGGFPGFSPGGPYPWNRGWAPRSAIACRGDGRRCPCDD